MLDFFNDPRLISSCGGNLRMMRFAATGVLTVFATAIDAPATAQDESPAPAKCELHVWPSDKFAVTENLGGTNLGLIGGLIDEATRLKSPEGVKKQFETQLSPLAQAKVISDLKINVVLGIPDYETVIEPADSQPIWTFEQQASADRLSRTAPVCYAELAIISNQYFKQTIGTRLRTYVRYREFDAKGLLRAKVQDTTATKASDFPAKSEDRVAVSAASIQEAFRVNLIKVAKDKLKR